MNLSGVPSQRIWPLVKVGAHRETKTETVVEQFDGKTVMREVTVEVETRCGPGFWCSAGKKIPCPINTYNERKDADDQSYCVPCPENARTAGESSTSFRQRKTSTCPSKCAA